LAATLGNFQDLGGHIGGDAAPMDAFKPLLQCTGDCLL
jgi:hypothetical protein